MTRSQMIHARVEPGLKRQAEAVFRRLGLSASDVLNALYSQVAMRKGIPFPLEIPNEETCQAIEDARRGRNLKSFKTKEDLFRDLGIR